MASLVNRPAQLDHAYNWDDPYSFSVRIIGEDLVADPVSSVIKLTASEAAFVAAPSGDTVVLTAPSSLAVGTYAYRIEWQGSELIAGTIRVAAAGTPGTSTVDTVSLTIDRGENVVQVEAVLRGEGVPLGGTTGQALVKTSNADFDTEWADVAGGGGGVPDGDKGDITVSGGLWTIDPEARAAIIGEATNATQGELDAHTSQTTAAHGGIVPSARTISTTAPLTGGGDLSANRTLAVSAATATAVGVVELATAAEATAQTDNTRAVTPLGLADRVPTGRTISTTAPLIGGGDLSANRTLAVSAASEAAAGVLELATNAETTTGSDTTRATHPAGVKAAIDAAIAALIDSSPGTLDTLNELAAALGDDPNFAATMTTALAGKQPIDSDLTAIAALTTTTYGRAFLALADQAALMALVQAASTTVQGKVELATTAEATAQTDTARAVTPAGLADRVLTSRSISTTAPLTGGGDLTANRTLAVSTATDTAVGVVELATTAETGTGTDTARAVTPAAGAGSYARVYVHNGTNYAIAGGRTFYGPEDPTADGFTMVDGDAWEDPT